jgi:CBS-domain-containing membrane protein
MSSTAGPEERTVEQKRARDIMIPLEEYPHIPYWFTLRQAVAEMESSQLERDGRKSLPRGVLVFDERYQLRGKVRRRDLLRGLEPEFLAHGFHHQKQPYGPAVDANLSELSFDRIAGGLRERAEQPVSEVMLPVKSTVQADDHLLKLVHEMTREDLSFIPVLQEGRVVGVVRTVELLHEVARLVL